MLRITKRLGLLHGLLTAALLGGCAAPLPTPTGEEQAAPGQLIGQAEESTAKGNYVIAAQTYLQLAGHSTGAERQQFLLTAATILLRGQHLERARTTMAAIDPKLLPSEGKVQYQLNQARIALLELQPQRALQQLHTPATTLSPTLAPEWYGARADAYAMAGNYLEAVRERIKLENNLSDSVLIQRNHQQIWQDLTQLTPTALQTLRSAPPPDVLSGWLELGYLYKEYATRPDLLPEQLRSWQEHYPDHPATGQFLDDLLHYQEILFERPRHIALLLPLSGSFAAPANAVRDGFLAAYYSRTNRLYAPEIKIYDTTEDVATGIKVYQQAVAAGADFIVGPLHKPLLEALAQQEEMPVKTLALNYLGSEEKSADNLFQFGLLPEDEARQVAERAWLDGQNKALVLAPEGEWGDRMLNTFEKYWQQLDGKVLEAQRYDPAKHDFSSPVVKLLNIDESRQRGRDLRHLLGINIKYEPRRRQDVDFIYLAAFPNQARQIRPQLKFYYADAVPVYSTSHVYGGEVNTTQDRDMDGIIFCDMPWVFEGGRNHQTNWKMISKTWKSDAVPFKRLYAMGIDAYHLIGRLNMMGDNAQANLNAETGNLYLDGNRRIHRQLLWARFSGGKPRLIDTAPANTNNPS
jgi:outer membrane PBP1 activator LpoA protein